VRPKIIVFSGSRADFGILKKIYLNLKNNKKCNPILVLGNQHYNKIYNNTFKEAKTEKIKIDFKLSYNLVETTRGGIIDQLSSNSREIKNILIKSKPDICILLGDRYEVHLFGLCCFILGIPIAHIHGGEITHGSFDDGFRHSLSKFSNIHFVSHKSHKKRLIKLGENPKFIFNYGAPGAENAKNLTKGLKLNKNLINNFKKDLIVITYHTQTNKNFSEDLFILKNIFKLILLNKTYKYIFTNSNSDPGGSKIMKEINKFCKKKNNCFNAKSLGHTNYLLLLSESKIMIGNSSSGIIEASTLKVPFLNIGDRQKGRLKSNNVIDTKLNLRSMEKGFNKAMKLKKKKIKDIFYRTNSSKKIADTIIESINNSNINNPKTFYEKK